MARRPRVFAPGLLYHVIVRGNQRQKTFVGERDYQSYLERLGKYRRKFDVALYAYCLMPNHIHLLLETSSQPLSKFMQGLQQSYTQYFNRTHRKVGHLFQSRYKAIVCDRDEYLIELVRYIHLNPVRAGLVRRPEQYTHSGHRFYLKGDGTGVLDPRPVLNMLGGRKRYEGFVLMGIDTGHNEEYYQVEDQRFLGNEGFGEKVRKKVEEQDARQAKRPLDAALKKLAKEVGSDVDILRSPDRSWEVSKIRALVAYVLVRRLGYRLVEVAAHLGRDTATVSTLTSRFSERMQLEARLKKNVERLIEIV